MKTENFYRSIPIILTLALCIFHFIFLLYFFSPAISTPDAQGYFAQGKIIAKYSHSYFIPQNNLQYIGPHWHSADEQKYFTTFPLGFPCLIAIIYRLFGANSTFLINPILASISLLVFFFLCKNWLSNNWSLVAAFFLAINPFYNEHALWGGSHISLIFFFLLALLLLIKTIYPVRPLVSYGVYGISAGIAIGIVPTIRYAEFVLCFSFGCYILWLFFSREISKRTFISIVLGILIPLLPLAIRNQIAFGKFWVTGYGFSNAPAALFGFNYLIEHFIPFLVKLVTDGMGILFPLSIIGFVILLKNSETRSTTVYLLSSTVALTLLYMAYYWPTDPQSMRFLLPTFPIYTLAAVYFINQLSKNYRIALLSITTLVSLSWGVSGSLRAVKPLHMRNSILENITDAIEKNIKDGSIIITYEGICQNLDLKNGYKFIFYR
ncbi:MAG: glycosyltransferase family 39 protein [Elusimicrobiota bacterium]